MQREVEILRLALLVVTAIGVTIFKSVKSFDHTCSKLIADF